MIKNGCLGFGQGFDNLHGHSPEEVMRFIAWVSLLYEAAVISDSWLATNKGLYTLITERGGAELLRQGILIQARRDTASSFAEVHGQVLAKKMHGVIEDPGFPALVDAANADVIAFPMGKVGSAYKSMVDKIFTAEVLVALGISEKVADRVVACFDEGRAAKTDVHTNTFVFNTVCPRIIAEGSTEAEAQAVMDVARAPYSLNLPVMLGTGIAGIDTFDGGRVLAALRGHTETGMVGVSRSGTVESAFSHVFRNPAIAWLFGNDVLSHLTVEDLVAARSTENRGVYLDLLGFYLATPTADRWAGLIVAMEKYLEGAGITVANRWLHDGRLKIEPREGTVLIEGGTALRVQFDKPVMLTGSTTAATTADVSLETADVQIIGKTVAGPPPVTEG